MPEVESMHVPWMHGLEAHVFPNKYINIKVCVLNMFQSNAYVRKRCKKPKLINRLWCIL